MRRYVYNDDRCWPYEWIPTMNTDDERLNDIVSGSVLAYIPRTRLASHYSQKDEGFCPKAEWATLLACNTRCGK